MRALLVLVLLGLWAGMLSAPAFDPDRFSRHLMLEDRFWRQYLGCPAKGYPPAIDCRLGAGVLNARLWHEVEASGRAMYP
jgi:hypothetical protein